MTLTERDQKLIEAQVHLKEARHQLLEAAKRVDGIATVAHKRVMASIAANDLAQESVAAQLIDELPAEPDELPPPA